MITTTTTPDIEAVWLELERLNVPMRGWWYEPEIADDIPGPSYGMEVAPEALTDSDATWMVFEWDEETAWTMNDACDGMAHGPVALDIPDPFDVPAVAEHLRKVVVGEIDEFRRVGNR